METGWTSLKTNKEQKWQITAYSGFQLNVERRRAIHLVLGLVLLRFAIGRGLIGLGLV